MRSTKWTKRIVVQGLLTALVSSATVYAADAPAAKWYDGIGLSGYVQTSYTGNLNTPTDGSGGKVGNTARQFDTDSNGFNFNAFLLQIAKPVADDHVGFTVRLRMGEDAKTLTANTATATPGDGSYLWVQEAYLTYATTSKLSIIGGKFVTPEGYEVVDSIANPNFSLGLLFFAAEPIGHTGIKANYVFGDKLNATLGVVNGWDGLPANQGAAPDVNTAKTLLFQVATTPTKSLAWYVTGLYGKELPDPSSSERLSLDTVVTWALTDRLSLAAQGNWGEQSNDPAYASNSGGINRTDGTTHWEGVGFWASFAESAKWVTSARFELLGDENYANRFGFGTFPTTNTTNQTVREFTLTQKHMLTPAMGVRAEYRHDWSTEAMFRRNDGSFVRDQNTVSADWFVTF